MAFAFFRSSRIASKAPLGIAVGGFAVALAAFVWTLLAWSGNSDIIPGQPDVPLGVVSVDQQVPPAPPASGEPRLYIEKIGVNIPIVEGTNEQALLKGAWRSPFGSTPDKGGKTVLFGHRWLHKPPEPETFYNLDKLVVGDIIKVDWNGKTYTYRVVETKVVSPKEISVLDQTETPTLTLITCTPLYTTKQRIVVHAELIP